MVRKWVWKNQYIYLLDYKTGYNQRVKRIDHDRSGKLVVLQANLFPPQPPSSQGIERTLAIALHSHLKLTNVFSNFWAGKSNPVQAFVNHKFVANIKNCYFWMTYIEKYNSEMENYLKEKRNRTFCGNLHIRWKNAWHLSIRCTSYKPLISSFRPLLAISSLSFNCESDLSNHSTLKPFEQWISSQIKLWVVQTVAYKLTRFSWGL